VDFRFHELSAAKAWGMSPEVWDVQSLHARAEMLSHEMLCATREAYVSEQAEKKGKDPSPARTGRSTPFDVMRKRAGIG